MSKFTQMSQQVNAFQYLIAEVVTDAGNTNYIRLNTFAHATVDIEQISSYVCGDEKVGYLEGINEVVAMAYSSTKTRSKSDGGLYYGLVGKCVMHAQDFLRYGRKSDKDALRDELEKVINGLVSDGYQYKIGNNVVNRFLSLLGKKTARTNGKYDRCVTGNIAIEMKSEIQIVRALCAVIVSVMQVKLEKQTTLQVCAGYQYQPDEEPQEQEQEQESGVTVKTEESSPVGVVDSKRREKKTA